MFSFLLRRTYAMLAAAFMAGIVYANGILQPPVSHYLLALVALAALFGCMKLLHAERHFAAAFLSVAVFALGAGRLWAERSLAAAPPLISIVEKSPGTMRFTGRVKGFPRLGGEYVRAMVEVDSAEGIRTGKPLGKMMLFWKAGEERDLTWGDRISFIASAKVGTSPVNPGEFDYSQYLFDRGTKVEAFAFGESWVKRRGGRPWILQAHIDARKTLFDALAHYQPSPEREILISLVYGDKTTALDPQVEEDFRRAGLTHILVVSGTQVSLIVFLLIGFLAPARDDFTRQGIFRRFASGAIVVGAVMFYCTMTGFETSVVRALIMGIIVLAAKLLDREPDGLTELMRATLIILAFQPGQLFGASLQLSFSACFGLIYVYGLFGGYVKRAGTAAAKTIAATLITTGGAQLFVSPVLVVHFNQISAWGLFANLIAIPLSSLLLVLGIFYNLIGLFGVEILNRALSYVLFIGLKALIITGKIFGNLPYSDMKIATPEWREIAIFYAMLLLLGETWRWRRTLFKSGRMFVPCALIATLGAVLTLSATAGEPARPRVVVLATATGLAMFGEDASGNTFAIVQAAGQVATKRNLARKLQAAMRHYGKDAPASITVFGDAGEEGLSVLRAMKPRWLNLATAGLDSRGAGRGTAAIGGAAGGDEGAAGAESASTSDQSGQVIFTGDGLAAGWKTLDKDKPERIVISVAIHGREALVFLGEPTKKQVQTEIEKSRPDAALAGARTAERISSLLDSGGLEAIETDAAITGRDQPLPLEICFDEESARIAIRPAMR